MPQSMETQHACVCVCVCVCVFFLFSVVNEVFSEQYRGLNVYMDPPPVYLHMLWDVVCPEKRSKKKNKQKQLFIWVNPPRPFPFAIGRESSQWVGGEVDFLWASYTGPTCKIFLTSPMVFILKRKKENVPHH